MGVNWCTAGLANIVRAVRFSMFLVVSLFILFGLVSCGGKNSQGEDARQGERSQEEYQSSLPPTSGTAEPQAIQWHPVTRWPSDAEYEGMAEMLFKQIARSEPIIGGARIVENAIAVSPDHSLIAVGTERGWVEFIDAETGDLLYILTLAREYGPPPNEIRSLGFFEGHLVATSQNGQITFSDLDTLTVRFAETCEGRAGLAVDPINGIYLYLTMGSIVIRDFYTGALVRKIECFDDGPIEFVAQTQLAPWACHRVNSGKMRTG